MAILLAKINEDDNSKIYFDYTSIEELTKGTPIIRGPQPIQRPTPEKKPWPGEAHILTARCAGIHRQHPRNIGAHIR
jgi:hypothetical protein